MRQSCEYAGLFGSRVSFFLRDREVGTVAPHGILPWVSDLVIPTGWRWGQVRAAPFLWVSEKQGSKTSGCLGPLVKRRTLPQSTLSSTPATGPQRAHSHIQSPPSMFSTCKAGDPLGYFPKDWGFFSPCRQRCAMYPQFKLAKSSGYFFFSCSLG